MPTSGVNLSQSGHRDLKEKGAAAKNQQPRVSGRTQRAWTSQQGKAGAISGQRTTFPNWSNWKSIRLVQPRR